MTSSLGGAFSGTSKLDGLGVSEVVSTSGFEDEMLVNFGNNEDYNVLSLSSLSPRFTATRNNQENEDRMKGNNGFADKRTLRHKRALRNKSRRGYSVKPLSSLDSCLIAQLYNEHVEMEEYVFSSFPSPSMSSVRPLLVTDGSRVISRASNDSFSMPCKLHKEDDLYSDLKKTVVGVPPLPEIDLLQLPKKPKRKKGTGSHGRLSSPNTKVSSKQLQYQGSHDRMFLLCLGITLGVMSTVTTNRREVDKLNDLLKQTENLVQDLHEELEMKDSLTVKVLPHEGSETQESNDRYFANQDLGSFSSGRDVNDIRTPEKHRSGENSVSRSKIEAELEAELERLELSMNASSLERRLSGILEIDPDSVADIVHGELRVDMVKGGGDRTDSGRGTSGTSTIRTENANYAVCPQELSLRLHEVIQSRLQKQITELETALESSQKKLQSMESSQINLWRKYSNSEIGSSPQESPTLREENNNLAEPLFLNLSGDALDAYNEAYEELTKITETDEDSPPPFMAYKNNQFKEELQQSDHSVLWSRDGSTENGFKSVEVVEIQDENDDDDDDDDEMARLLIKQIVEKTRQGSPVVLNAQRMLFQMDEKA
ncbi:hypothetical protein IFM89_016393 [Coptis chinensis]|uniref:Uncharacterized protein n=1 Tax=Coptis chinensis TaxID=261450 RepID=A0A835HF85_9MAGN|nr:hypothetical protein IFM89_016393 [Coptis chinensis]